MTALQNLFAAYATATPGDWYLDKSEGRIILPHGPDVLNWDDAKRQENAAFIVPAHNTMPTIKNLLARAADSLQDYCAEANGDMNDGLAMEIYKFLEGVRK